jgi:hypothetical protein
MHDDASGVSEGKEQRLLFFPFGKNMEQCASFRISNDTFPSSYGIRALFSAPFSSAMLFDAVSYCRFYYGSK